MQIKKIIQECLEGKRGAWEMLVNAYSKRILNMAFQFSGNFQEAEDLTQEIFLKLYCSLPKYDIKRNFNAWLLTLAKNYMIDQYRRQKWEKTRRNDFDERLLTSETFQNPENGIIEDESRKMIMEGLNCLSSDIRIAVILRDIQGKKYEEVAEIMDLPLGTVKSRINRGRIQLAKVLKDNKEKKNGL